MQSIALVWDISQMSTEELINDERKEVVILHVCWIISQRTEENFPERYLY